MAMAACYQMVDTEMVYSLQDMTADEVFEVIEELQEMDEMVLDIDKLWDGLHFLLTKVTASEPLEGNPLSEAIVGVKYFSDEEDAYFIAYILPESVSTIMNELERFDIDGAIEGFQPKEFAQAGIYPNIWMNEDNEALKKELKDCFFALVHFYEKAVEMKKAVIVSIY